MKFPISIRTAFCLPEPDVNALVQGQTIVALSRSFLQAEQQFALCPIKDLEEDCDTTVQAWAQVEECRIFTSSDELYSLSRLTPWKFDDLKSSLQTKNRLFVACLRVYNLSDDQEMLLEEVSPDRIGGFTKLPNWLSIPETKPVLEDSFFTWQREQLKNLQPHHYVENQKSFARADDFDFRHHLLAFLKLQDENVRQITPDQKKFIDDIVDLGERSKRLDEGKSNYQAGTDFENIVRQALEFLGFVVESQHKGGAGGLDVYCSRPYPLIVECKAGKKIPSDTTEQLMKLGGMHLGTDRLTDRFYESAKLIIGPGEPTADLKTAAEKWNVSIMSPNVLQRLVKIQTKYPNTINLVELKEYLKPGVVNDSINDFVEEKILKRLRLYSCVINAISNFTNGDCSQKFNSAKVLKSCRETELAKELEENHLHNILVELSSPFAGYLGRETALDGDWRHDLFYFLRDFVIEEDL